MLKIDVITLFPDTLETVIGDSVLGRGRDKKLFDIRFINLRDFATDKHKTVDDTRFGGGGGMVLKPEPLSSALDSLELDYKNLDREKNRIVLTSAAGRKFDQQLAIKYSLMERLVIICGHYKGVDERILQLYPVEEVSVGDFVLTGGEPAAWIMLDAVLRLIPGVMGNFESGIDDSFTEDLLLGAPVYTRPAEFKGLAVPDELMSGDHAEINRYRRRMAIKKTFEKRPDLLEKVDLTDEEIEFLEKIKKSK